MASFHGCHGPIVASARLKIPTRVNSALSLFGLAFAFVSERVSETLFLLQTSAFFHSRLPTHPQQQSSQNTTTPSTYRLSHHR